MAELNTYRDIRSRSNFYAKKREWIKQITWHLGKFRIHTHIHMSDQRSESTLSLSISLSVQDLTPGPEIIITVNQIKNKIRN